ncbi:VOC family protein [Nonomuraea soli]|uniref:Catechol 2,3-dioxygenase-like lactoylglutathione lyase family enzyme n=1 Tax=Nonomuraea soli TaxID=1032476 RepID=A0A7W0CTS7_9ACTN|nr:VOC family protein [Nonomuraea soli]MBA2897211.1 catechol 2,3-dioxygenase-like lactoylglutathione lyase family enzyme [Nonomuraea soli]
MFITGVRHLKIWVTDLGRSRAFYEKVFRLEHSISFADDDGVVRGMSFRIPGVAFELAIRENPELAKAMHDADPFALATTREGLEQWVEHLDRLDIWHPPIVRASRGWACGFRDPDGIQIRLYAYDEEVAGETGDHVVSGGAPKKWMGS